VAPRGLPVAPRGLPAAEGHLKMISTNQGVLQEEAGPRQGVGLFVMLPCSQGNMLSHHNAYSCNLCLRVATGLPSFSLLALDAWPVM
jgi:hypothetical protein